MKRFVLLIIWVWCAAAPALAQKQRHCSDYLNARDASAILGTPVEVLGPQQGRYTHDAKLEWHFCAWENRPKNVSLIVSLQQWASPAEMRASLLSRDELGRKVKIESIPRLGDAGAVYINEELGTLIVTASKGSKIVGVTLDAHRNQIPPGARYQVEGLAEKLWTQL